MIITPQIIEQAAKDIVSFWEASELPDADKAKILEMVKDYYADKDDHVFERYLAELCKRTIDRRVPATSFEQND
jgi:predicted kinase